MMVEEDSLIAYGAMALLVGCSTHTIPVVAMLATSFIL
jgi:hypothetical protein